MRYVKIIGLLLIGFIFYTELIAVTILNFGGTIENYIFILSFLVNIITLYFALYRKNAKEYVIAVIGFIFLFSILLYFSGNIYSEDWDGNTYHKLAVGLLKNGWSPLKESADTFTAVHFPTLDTGNYTLWIDHYGKASWMIAAVIYSLTSNIECGKIYQCIAVIAVFLLYLSFLHEKGFTVKKAITISTLLAFNPVSLVQLFSYYVDGFLFSYMFILIIGLTYLTQKEEKLGWMIIFYTMPVLANIKFTGLLYGGIFCIIYYGYLVLKERKREKNFLKISFKKGVIFALLAISSIGWFGFLTYIKNYLDHGTITYPLTGLNVDIMTNNSPVGFIGKNRFYKLFYSLFGQTANITSTSDIKLPALKIPFTVSKQEIYKIPDIDIRIGGFGVFFSGLLLLSIIAIVVIIWRRENEDILKNSLILNIFAIFVLILIVPESWWARYAPFVYFIPITALMLLLFKNRNQWFRYILTLFIITFFINNSYFALQPLYTLKESVEIKKDLDQLSGQSIEILHSFQCGKIFNLIDWSISYHIVDKLENCDGVCYGVHWKYRK